MCTPDQKAGNSPARLKSAAFKSMDTLDSDGQVLEHCPFKPCSLTPWERGSRSCWEDNSPSNYQSWELGELDLSAQHLHESLHLYHTCNKPWIDTAQGGLYWRPNGARSSRGHRLLGRLNSARRDFNSSFNRLQLNNVAVLAGCVQEQEQTASWQQPSALTISPSKYLTFLGLLRPTKWPT